MQNTTIGVTMSEKYLNNEEKNLIDQIHNDEYVKPADMQNQMDTISTMAKEMSTKKIPLNIRR
ncbi:MAG: hypothetical protein ACLFOC_11840 [Campylobacterales bacterium]